MRARHPRGTIQTRMGAKNGDVSARRGETTLELGQDDLVEEPSSEGPPTLRPVAPPPGPSRKAPPGDEGRRARAWLDECERELATEPDASRAARLCFEMARNCEIALGDLRRALQYYRAALEHAPDYVPAIRAARRLLIGAQMFADALALFDAEARVTRQARDKATLFLLKGRLLEDVLGNREAAEQAYQTAHALDRTHASILRATEQRLFAKQRWEEVDRNLAELANASARDDAHRAALIIRRAQLLESRQREPEQAAELYETALQLDPSAGIAVQALKRLYYGQRRWRDLIRTARDGGDALDRSPARSFFAVPRGTHSRRTPRQSRPGDSHARASPRAAPGRSAHPWRACTLL